MRHLIHRVIEWRDGDDHPKQGIALGKDTALTPVRCDVTREHLPVVLQCRLSRESEHIANTAHFVARILQAQTRFERNERAQRIDPLHHDGRGALEDLRTIGARQSTAKPFRPLDGAADIFDPCLGHGSDHLRAPRIADLDDSAITRMTFAINTHRFSVKSTELFGSHVLAAHHRLNRVARGAPAAEHLLQDGPAYWRAVTQLSMTRHERVMPRLNDRRLVI